MAPRQNAQFYPFFSGFSMMNVAETFCGCHHTPSFAPCQRQHPPGRPSTCYRPKTSRLPPEASWSNDKRVCSAAVAAAFSRAGWAGGTVRSCCCCCCCCCCYCYCIRPNCNPLNFSLWVRLATSVSKEGTKNREDLFRRLGGEVEGHL